MSINVVFSKVGFYHPAFGRLGRGDRDRGKVYTLPDFLAEAGKLPSSAKIITNDVLEEVLEANEQPKPAKPKVVDEEAFKKAQVTGRGREKKPDSAQKRTTGKDAPVKAVAKAGGSRRRPLS